MTKSLLLSGAFLFCLGLLWAEGSGEREELPQNATANIYLVLRTGESDNNLMIERYYLPASLSAMVWSGFTARSGSVEFAASGGYRIRSQKKTDAEPLGAYGVYTYTLEVSYYSSVSHTPQSIYSVNFEYADPDSSRGVTSQPASRALLEGIRRCGKANGQARVLQIQYLGKGRFKAKVGIR